MDPGETSAKVRQRVQAARDRQLSRPGQVTLNAHLPPAALPKLCEPDAKGRQLLDTAFDRLGLTIRETGDHPPAGAHDRRPRRGGGHRRPACRRGDPVPEPGEAAAWTAGREGREMTPSAAQAELRNIAEELLAIEDRLRGLLEACRGRRMKTRCSRVRWRGT